MSEGLGTRLSADDLRLRCDPASIPYDSTEAIPDPTGVVGQPRAVAALEFAVGVQHAGYNIYALGPPGTGKQSIITRYLEGAAKHRPPPHDLCYVHNFADPHSPVLLHVPPGVGKVLRRDMEKFIDEARSAIAETLESERYHERRKAINQAFKDMSEQAFENVESQAKQQGLGLLKTPFGMSFVPVRDGKVLSDEDVEALPPDEREQVSAALGHSAEQMQKVLRQASRWDRERRAKVREMERELTTFAVEELLNELKRNYRDHEGVLTFLNAVQHDVIERAREIAGPGEDDNKELLSLFQQPGSGSPRRRYIVNVIVDQSDDEDLHAPVVYEDNPTYENLVGRIEHHSQFGVLYTDATHIKAGALHRAHGGFLVVDALRVLRSPYAWEGLKRVLQSKRVRIEPLGQALGLVTTVSLTPEPLELDVRVVMLGEPMLYYLLCTFDPDFSELFRVAADFDDRMDADHDGWGEYLQLVAMLVRQDGLRPFDRGALARILEHSRRVTGDTLKLTTRMNTMTDLLREADYWAGTQTATTVSASHVDRAIDAREYRADRLRERSQEHIRRGVLQIDTADAKIGQVNALTVVSLGEFAFGRPTRVTARVRLGSSGVVDIEREVELGGPIHSKGVLILQGFLAEQFATDYPHSLSASLVFEQSYGGVEGDSASAAELCALLSAIGRVPLSQAFAATGSVNQRGEIQAVGGINEKIEGFFDVCRDRGLTGSQAVIIPRSNVAHLMLRADVVEAVRDGQFHVHAVDHVDQMVALLTGIPAGTRGPEGPYAQGSVNAAVEARLREFAEQRRAFMDAGNDGEEPGHEHVGPLGA